VSGTAGGSGAGIPPAPAVPGRRTPALLLAAAGLAVATWLLHGYQFGVWPQLDPLEQILAMRGDLRGDWYTSHAPAHWVFDHLAALLPARALEPVFALVWAGSLVAFWLGFTLLGLDLGLGLGAIVAAGLIGARTSFAGFGASALLPPMLLPSGLGDAAAMFAVRFALAGRWRPAGVSCGLALLVHPRIGLLTLLVCTAAFLARGVRPAAGFALSALVIGGAPLLRVIATLGLAHDVSPARRFEWLAEARLPHHLVYSTFPAADYAAVAGWAALLIAALIATRPAPWQTAWGLFLGAIALLCAAGAVASARGGPTPLVELHTAWVSNWIPLLAVLAASAAFVKRRPRAGTLALFAVPAVTAAIAPAAAVLLGRVGLPGLPAHHLQALPLLALAAAFGAVSGQEWAWVRAPGPAAGLALALAILGFVASGWRWPARQAAAPEWRDIAERARQVSRPEDTFVTPPDQDGFSFLSHRPIVADFGNIPPDGLGAWQERLQALTGDPDALSGGIAGGLEARTRRIAEGYDRTVLASPAVARRYGATYIVTRLGLAPAPPWAERVAANGRYALYRVAGGGTP